MVPFEDFEHSFQFMAVRERSVPSRKVLNLWFSSSTAGVCSILPGGEGQGHQTLGGRALCGDLGPRSRREHEIEFANLRAPFLPLTF